MWDVKTGQQIGPEIKHRDEAMSIDCFGDNLILTASSDKCVRVLDADSGIRVGPPIQFPNALRSVKGLSASGHFTVYDIDGQQWMMHLPATELDASLLGRLASLLAGRLPSNAGLAPRAAAVGLEAEWLKMKAAHPSLFVASASEIVDWCRVEADCCWLKGLDSAELGFLRRLLTLRPDDNMAAVRAEEIQERLRDRDQKR